MWGLALRYAAAAVTPAAKGATHDAKERLSAAATHGVAAAKHGVKERLSAAGSNGSVKERLNPSTTDKGGKVGDTADALLAKMGKPGKLASKLSLGSRVIGRLTPDLNDDQSEDEPVAEEEAPIEEPEVSQGDGDEPVQEPQASEGEDEAVEEPAAPADESEPPDAPGPGGSQDEEDEDDEAKDPSVETTPDDRINPIKGHSEPVRAHPGADPLHTDFDHAYSDEVENYEHQDAYATPR